ncbi:unnamed protein product, partial [Rotaria sordida]
GCSAQWAQCGGIGWNGQQTCCSPYVCQYNNDWYSQCLTGSAQSATTASAQSATTASEQSATPASTSATYDGR